MELRFDGDNSYPGCEQCGRCCEINILEVSPEEVARVRAYIQQSGFVPTDYAKERCCLQLADGSCGVWEARPQVCRLFHCKVSRFEILRQNPSLVVEDKPLVDMHECFINDDASDPRYSSRP